MDGGVEQERKLQSGLDPFDGAVGNVQILGLLGLDDRDVGSIALDDGPVLSVGQGAWPGRAVGVDQEQDLGRGRSPFNDGLVQALEGQQVPVILLDV